MQKVTLLSLFILISMPFTLQAQTLKLEELLKTGVKKNPGIAKYMKLMANAEIKTRKALTAFYPDLSLGLNYAKKYSETHDPVFVATKKDIFSIELSISQLIFNGFQRFAQYDSAKINEIIQEESLKAIVSLLIYNIKDTYYKIELYQRQIAAIEAIILRRKQNLTITRLEYGAGKEKYPTVLEAEASLREAEYNLLDKTGALSVLKQNLLLMCGLEGNPDFSIETRSTDIPKSLNREQLLTDASANNTDLSLLRQQLKLEDSSLKLSTGAYYPTVSLAGGYGYSDSKMFPNNKDWSIGASITIPIFSAFSTYYENAAIRLKMQSIADEIADTENTLRSKINDYLSQYQTALKKKELLELKYRTASESYQLSKLEYKQGKLTYQLFEQKENALSSIELDREQIIYQLKNILISLEKLTAATEKYYKEK